VAAHQGQPPLSADGGGVKILALDIETAPHQVHVWGLFKQTVAINQIQETGRVMCFAARWMGERAIHFYGEKTHGHKETIKAAHELLNEADSVLTYNGRSFDVPTLNKEFLKYDINPPVPFHHVDLYQVVKSRFRFASNKLDHICQELGIGKKVRHEGHDLWVQCMKGDEKAWKRMERYNRKDVLLLEKLYARVLPWIETHPNWGLYLKAERPTCPTCGSTKLQARGSQTSRTQKYTRYHCQVCGTWSRSRFREAKNENVLVQIGG
jgi:DNA polymerase elongation subunit (family B)